MHIQKSFKDETKTNFFYIIPTPIGNLEDMTLRSINILKKVDTLYCEDTRVSQKLLNHLNIKVSTKTYNEYSFEKEAHNILKQMESGQNIGLISDAGLPCISDPGYKLVKYLKDNNQSVIVLPGATAFVLPMVYSTFKSSEYTYLGFLSKKNSVYSKQISELCTEKRNVIFYETPYRIVKTLTKIQEIDASRKLLIARELTKIYEEYLEGTVTEILEHFQINKPKGEFVVIVEGSQDSKIEYDINQEIDQFIAEGLSKKDAIKKIASISQKSKNLIYNEYLEYEKNKNE